jgi:anti-sigma regulatory factor (Ser/Thr protein kinase)
MAYVSCPNCEVTLASAISVEPPSVCPDCCAKLVRDAALSSPARRPLPAPRPEPPPSYDAVLAIGRDTPREARHAFESFAKPYGTNVTSIGSLLLSEVVTNAVIHGPLAAGATVALHFERAGDSLQVEVADDGPGFVPRPRYHGQDPGAGWGLHLVQEMAGTWGVDRGRPTRVWFELGLR